MIIDEIYRNFYRYIYMGLRVGPNTPARRSSANTETLDSLKLLLGPKLSSQPLVLQGLMDRFELKNGIFTSKDYNGRRPFLDNDRIFCFDGMRSSPLIIGSLKDLAYYTVWDAKVMGSKAPLLRFGDLSYLEKYLLIPTKSGKMVFLSDQHTHALYGLALAKKLGITNGFSALFHIDEHIDNEFPNRTHSRPNLDDLARVAILCQEKLEITNFLSPGQTFDRNNPLLFNDTYYVLTGYSNKGIETTFISEPSGGLGGMKLSIEKALEYINACKEVGLKIIIDIDLDYFAAYFGESSDKKLTKESIKKQMSYEQNLQFVLAITKKADFITIATSPDFFKSQKTHAREILERIINNL